MIFVFISKSQDDLIAPYRLMQDDIEHFTIDFDLEK